MWLIMGNKGQHLKEKHANLFEREYHLLLSEKVVGMGIENSESSLVYFCCFNPG